MSRAGGGGGVLGVPDWSSGTGADELAPERDARIGLGPCRDVADGGAENRRSQSPRLADDGGCALGLAWMEQAIGGGDPGEGLVAREPADEVDGSAELARLLFELSALGAIAYDDEVRALRLGERDRLVGALRAEEAATDDPEPILRLERERASELFGSSVDVGDLDGGGLDPGAASEGLLEIVRQLLGELTAESVGDEAEACTSLEQRSEGGGTKRSGQLPEEADVAAVGDDLDFAGLHDEAERQAAGDEEVEDRAVEGAAPQELPPSPPEERKERRGPGGPLAEAGESAWPAEQNRGSEPYDVDVGARSSSAFARCQNQDSMPFLRELSCFGRDEVAGRVALVARKGSRQKDNSRGRGRMRRHGRDYIPPASIRARLRRRRAASLAFFRRLIDGFM